MKLLAKSEPPNDDTVPPSILEHCSGVREAAEAVWAAIEADLADGLVRDPTELRQSILPLYLTAAQLHDLGKANSAFQALVDPDSTQRKRQPIRHEILAGVLLTDERFWGQWFTKAFGNRDSWSVVWAVAGHHLEFRRKRPDETEDPLYRTGGVPRSVKLYVDDDQILRLLEAAAKLSPAINTIAGTAPVLDLAPFDPLDDSKSGLEAAVCRFVRRSDSYWRRTRHDRRFQEDVALLKALLIAADVAASTMVESDKQITSCIGDWLSTRLGHGQAGKIARDNLDGNAPRKFQESVAASDRLVTVVTAGCGNGKTTAAYLWGDTWAEGRKLFFAYPTTGTASAGFQDYLFGQSELERTLMHSRAEADLRAMLDSPTEDESPVARAQRSESLIAWGQQVIACTVDTVVGLVQNQRRPLFGFPAIACGAFVFDEVHSYDRRLFGELLRFIATFPGVPMLIMSASIPPSRLDALRQVAGDRMNPEPIHGDEQVEGVKRYHLHLGSEEDCWSQVQDALLRHEKVLWVCNTVGGGVRVFRAAQERFAHVDDLRLLLYHSRFRYGGLRQYPGRVERQREVLAEFKYADVQKTRRRRPGPALAVTTQVCEMSLNISADLLVSALCPLPSLVQRLGRLNRHTIRDDPKPALVYPFGGRPYHEEDPSAQMKAAEEMIRQLEGAPSSQTELAGFVDRLYSEEDSPKYSAWLDGGWQSESLPAREGDNSITVVRAEDLDRVGRPWNPANVVPWTIPMLFKRGFTWERRVAGYPVARKGTVLYDETEGASWANFKTV
ncbi:MAG: CRISPR-associated helicase Cas3' [bacterium]